jgi:DNA ligase D-like protein (predicted ligase)
MARFPDWVEPMAATLTQERFDDPGWVYERKFDGIRLLAFKDRKGVRLYSRNRLSQNASYSSVVEAIDLLPATQMILDGEATGVWGKQGAVAYNVFDLLWLDGRDLMHSSLDVRRLQLEALPLKPPLAVVKRMRDERPWERACREGWEGIVAKRRDSTYEQRRSRHWLKMKCEASQELVVGGFTDPRGSRVGLGALLVGYFEGDDFVFAGKVGTGFNTALLRDLRARLDAIEVQKPPFTRAVGLPKLAHWVRPVVVVQVGFIEWTGNDKLRHPRLLGIHTDKTARDVLRERP